MRLLKFQNLLFDLRILKRDLKRFTNSLNSHPQHIASKACKQDRIRRSASKETLGRTRKPQQRSKKKEKTGHNQTALRRK